MWGCLVRVDVMEYGVVGFVCGSVVALAAEGVGVKAMLGRVG